MTTITIHPQEDPRPQVPQQFLNDYLDLIHCHITGVNSRLVYNIDETWCSDWEERRSCEGIIPVEQADGPIHFGVSRRIKRHTMLVCINTSGESPCPLIITTDRSTTSIFRDGIE
jgi:hypothetical protein